MHSSGPVAPTGAHVYEVRERDCGRPCVAICKVDRQEPTATVTLSYLVDMCAGGCYGPRGVHEYPVTMSLEGFVRLCVATEPPPERAP